MIDGHQIKLYYYYEIDMIDKLVLGSYYAYTYFNNNLSKKNV